MPADIYWLGLLLAATLSWLGVKDQPTFFFNLGFLLAAYIVYFITENIVYTPKRIKLFFGVLLASTAIVAIIGLVQYLAYHDIVQHFPYFPVPYRPVDLRIYGNRVYSTFGQPNNMGLYLSLGLLAGLYFLLESNPEVKWRKWGITAGILLFSGVLVFVLDASGGLGLYSGLAGIGVYLWLGGVYLGRVWWSANRVKIGLFVIVVVLTICFSQGILSETSSWQRTVSSIQHTTGKATPSASITNRLVYWCTSLEMFRHSPLWGVGLGQFGLNYTPALASLISWSDSEFIKINAFPAGYAHNEFLQFLAETGGLGFIFFGLIWFMVFKHTHKTLKSNPSPLLLLTGSLFVPLFVQSLLSAPLRKLSIIMIFSFLLAVWVRQIPYYKKRTYVVSRSLGWLVIPLVFMFSVGLVLGTYDNWKAGKIMYQVLRLNKKGRLIQPLLIDQLAANPYIKFDVTAIMAKNALTMGIKHKRQKWVELAYDLYKEILTKLPTHKYCRYMATACFYLGKDQEGMGYITQGLSYVPSDKKLQRMLEHYQHQASLD